MFLKNKTKKQNKTKNKKTKNKKQKTKNKKQNKTKIPHFSPLRLNIDEARFSEIIIIIIIIIMIMINDKFFQFLKNRSY